MVQTMRLWFVFVTLLPVPALFGAEVNKSWEKLASTAKPGRRVVVLQHGRQRVEGKVLGVAAESIRLEVNSQPVTIPRGQVFRVRPAGTRSKRALIGLGAGVAAGVIFGANLGSRRHGLSAVVFGSAFGGIGAGVGAAIPAGAPLYEDPAPRSGSSR